MHQDDFAVLLDLIHQLLEALLKLSAILGAGHQQSHIQRHNLCTAEFIDYLNSQIQKFSH